MPLSRCLIVNADDLGLAEGINRGIARCHQDGILTSATLLANGPAFDDGIRIAKENPELGIGVHLNVIRGLPLGTGESVRPLLAVDGRLPGGFFEVGRRARKNPAYVTAVEGEYRRQIERCLGAGIHPTHLDSEKHHAAWKPLAQIVAKLAEEYGIPAIREYREPVWFAMRKLPWPGWKAIWDACLLRTYTTLSFSTDSLKRPRYFFGQTHIGQMTAPVWLALAKAVPPGISEAMCHPGDVTPEETADIIKAFGPTWLQEHRARERDGICDPEVVQAMALNDVRLVTFAGLQENAQ